MPRAIFWIILIGAIAIYPRFIPAHASISSCTASVDRHTITPLTSADFSFTLTNNDLVNPFRWMRITRPSTNFIINSTLNAPGWSNNVTSSNNSTIFNGSTAPGANQNVVLNVSTENVQAPPENWIIEVSDNPNGNSPTTCTGALDTEIAGQAPDTFPPNIADLKISVLSDTSARISWTTDEPATSQVFYGETIDYGSSSNLDSTLKTSHSVILTGLTPDTSYHFYVESTDAAGNIAQSGDSTFLTPVQSTVISPPTIIVLPSPATVPIKQEPTETTPPAITLTTKFSDPYQETPAIEGVATDNEAVARIDYSIDGGANWALVTDVINIGSKRVTFTFTPPNLSDGNYQIKGRATDTSGNIAFSDELTLIIDRLPPLVGGNVIAAGPQILYPDQHGIISTMVGVDKKISLAAVGGPTSITLSVSLPKNKEQIYNLTQSPSSGLWQGVLSFQKEGLYKIKARSLDGAGNTRERLLNTIQVFEPGKVTHADRGLDKAEVSIFTMDPVTKTWLLWDALPYSQKNPQTTNESGQFSILLPAGRYYLKIKASGFRTALSHIFSVEESLPLSTSIGLQKLPGFQAGPLRITLPWFALNFALNLSQAEKNDKTMDLIEKGAPNFALTGSKGPTETIDLRGKPTVLSFVNSWSPALSEQVPILADLQTNPDLNIVPLFPLEKSSKIDVLLNVAGHNLKTLVDPDGVTVEDFGFSSLPTHFFISRKGIIKKILSGVLSKEEIELNLVGL